MWVIGGVGAGGTVWDLMGVCVCVGGGGDMGEGGGHDSILNGTNLMQ